MIKDNTAVVSHNAISITSQEGETYTIRRIPSNLLPVHGSNVNSQIAVSIHLGILTSNRLLKETLLSDNSRSLDSSLQMVINNTGLSEHMPVWLRWSILTSLEQQQTRSVPQGKRLLVFPHPFNTD